MFYLLFTTDFEDVYTDTHKFYRYKYRNTCQYYYLWLGILYGCVVSVLYELYYF